MSRSNIGALIGLAAIAGCVIASPASADTLARSDGSEIVYHVSPQGTGRRGVLLVLQGSGCDPVIDREWLVSEPPILAPNHTYLAIEKYGVIPGVATSSYVENCSPDYWARNTLQQRVVDALQVIAHLRSEEWWNRELIVYGGSEGGAVAAMLAPLVPETKAVVIISSGIGVSIADLIKSAVPPPVAERIPDIVAEAKANPTGNKRFGGASYRWWADAADIVPARALLEADSPVLLIHGARDPFAPVSTARATRDLFASHGKTNLTYWEYEGFDHHLKDARGRDHRPEVLRRAADWLTAK